MPGIVGLVTKLPRRLAEAQLIRMVETLRHENFYVAGMLSDESLGVYAGWVARKESFSDSMPIRNERGDIAVVFSGEEFPEPGTPPRLKDRGYRPDASGPSYLVHIYEDDPTFPAGLNGRFHGVVLDRASGKAILFNDRYGMHRIYYHVADDAFYFAAEAKAILAVRPNLRALDPRGLGEFISCGCVLEDRTFFRGINTLPGGSVWTFRNGSIESEKTYFQACDWEDQEVLEPESYYRELRDVFSRNLPRYFSGPERVGMSLTGGLDTRMIMAWHKSPSVALPSYTFGGMIRECRDVIVARQVARACEQPHTVIPVGEEFLSRFPHYAERTIYLTDGCADVGRAPDLYLNERARQIAPVRMTGNYGGEVLRRVLAFKPEKPARDLFHPDVVSYSRRAEQTYMNCLGMNPLSFAVFRQGPSCHYGILALEETQLSMRTPFLDNDLVKVAFRAPQSVFLNDRVCRRLVADGSPELAQISTDRGIGGDRRLPGRVAAHIWQQVLFKAEYAYDLGMPQWLACINRFMSSYRLERLFLGRHKVFHFRVWYRDRLAGYVRETLLDPRALARPYLQRKNLERIVQRHLNGTRNYTNEIHRILSLELLQRLFVDPQ